jgi:hypothetical protein
MRPLHCERSRTWISLGLDGALSEFESIQLDRHLGGCPSCQAFAADAAAATRLLRDAPFEVPGGHIELPPGRISARRRGAAAFGIATAAAGLAAAIALYPGSSAKQATRATGLVARPAALALISYDAANLGVRHAAAHQDDSELVRGTFQLPTF